MWRNPCVIVNTIETIIQTNNTSIRTRLRIVGGEISTRRTPLEIEEEAVRLVLQGGTFRQISQELEVSLSTISRIVEYERQKDPDFESLRELSVRLRKLGLKVFDAKRACKLTEMLNELGISLKDLEDYIAVARKLILNEALGMDIITETIRLVQLEKEYGQPYQMLADDYENKQQETKKLAKKIKNLEAKISGFETKAKEAGEKLRETDQELERALKTRKGLSDIGLEKLASVVKFIPEFETLGFDLGQTKRLSNWKKQLEKTGINPDELDGIIAERGGLYALNSDLKLSKQRLTTQIQILTITGEKLRESPALNFLRETLRTRKLLVHCKGCLAPFLINIESREKYDSIVRNHLGLAIGCPNCGFTHMYDPREIASELGWALLPSETKTVNLPQES